MFFHLAYIDPGVGSMLLSIVIGAAATVVYLIRTVFMKLKYRAKGQKGAVISDALPYLIFSESKRYDHIFEPVLDEFEKRHIACAFWTMSEDDPLLKKSYTSVKAEYIGDSNAAWAKLNTASTDVLLSTTPGLEVYQWKRSKNVKKYVHIFHTLDTGLTYRMFGLDYYDAVLLSGDFPKKYLREIESLRNLPEKELITTGSTYMDSLKSKIDAFPQNNTLSTGEMPTTASPLVLVAPSWGKSSILSKFGEKFLTALQKTGYRIAVRPHPQSFISEKDLIDGLMKQFPESETFSWNRDNDNMNILNQADILISDFSGVVFDYALGFDKPVLYADTAFDSAPYDLAWSSYPLWNFEVLKKFGRQITEEDFSELKAIIDEMLVSEAYAVGREEVRAEAWMYPGKAAEKTVDALVSMHDALPMKEEVK